MNNTLNTPAQVFAQYLTAVEAYEVGGTQLQARWMQGRAQVTKARRAEAMQAAALLIGAACTVITAVIITFG